MFKDVIRRKLDNFQSCKYNQMIKKVKNYEYVSFDIFDTLIKRDVPSPEDVFALVGFELGIKNFKEMRIKAERNARKSSKSEEVNLEEIYSNLKFLGESVCQKAIEKEKEVEYGVVTLNQEIWPLYEYCKQNKRIILVSDMYLDRATIVKILDISGISGYQRLFISNEIGISKVQGDLYKYVISEMSLEKGDIIHIGNSYKADYLFARKNGIAAIKIATFYRRTDIKYNFLCPKSEQKRFLDTFINNHTPCIGDKKGEYFKFGYEKFGPLLYGFVNWLYNEFKSNSIEQVFFLARDGYIMRKAYKELGFTHCIQDLYLEVSRRSLRVPLYNKGLTYNNMIDQLSVPNKTNLIQIFDSLGLNIWDYSDKIDFSELNPYTHIKRDCLKENALFKNIYDQICVDIIHNADKEADLLNKYLRQFNFEKRTAIVDIGWGGSMQKCLLELLKENDYKFSITGYYIGLTQKSKENLGKNGYSAKGYAFDCLNDKASQELERPFVGLFETLFLEQDGSVMKYKELNDKIVGERYPYEYLTEKGYSKEAIFVREVQEGAIKFIKDLKKSKIKDFVGIDSKVMFANLYQTGIEPSIKDVNLFGDFEFFNNGSKVFLAKPQKLYVYFRKPRQLIVDLFDSQWKIGFLKRLLKIKLPYLKIFKMLRKLSN